MKTTLKYIILFIVAGLIIPLYTGAVKTAPVISTAKTDLIDNPIKRNGSYHFSVMHDVAAKLLPALNFFK